MGAIQTVKIEQMRYYGNMEDKRNLLPEDFTDTIEGKYIYMFLKSRPGLKITIDIDGHTSDVVLDGTGTYGIDLRDNTLGEHYINSIKFNNLEEYTNLKGEDINTTQLFIHFSKPLFSLLLGKDIRHADAK